MERAEVFESTQIGIQGTIGTPVNANLLLSSLSLTPKPVEPTEMRTARGSKIDHAQIGVKGRHTSAPFSGYQSFNDLALLYYSLLGIPTITELGAGAYRDLVWLLKARDADDVRNLTVEVGGDAGQSRFADGSVVSMEHSWSQTTADYSGQIIGKPLAEEGVVMTATPTEVPDIPISPDLFDLYVHDTIAGLTVDANNLSRFMDGNLNIGERRGPLFPLRSSFSSFAAMVEKKNTVTAHIEVEQDTESDAMLRQLRQRLTRYARFIATGPEITAGVNYEAEWTLPFKVTNPDRGPKDDVYGGMYDLAAINDVTLGGFLKVRIRTPWAAANFGPATALAAGQTPDTLNDPVL